MAGSTRKLRLRKTNVVSPSITVSMNSGWLRSPSACRAPEVQDEDPDTPGYLRGDRLRRDLGDLGSWECPPWLARDETLPQYLFNRTKPHTGRYRF